MTDSIPSLELDVPSALAEPLGRAFREFGFVGIRGHGIPDTVVEEAYRVSAEFFSWTAERKRQTEVVGGAGQRGYTPFGREIGKDATHADLKEFWHVGREEEDRPGAPRPHPWPENFPAFRHALRELYRRLESLGKELLRAVALHLGEPEHFFDAKVERGDSILRALHYPALRGVPDGERAAAHEDIDLLTLLVGAGEPGLEILGRRGDWIPVRALAGTIVCNVGDMLQRMTNHALLSTTHRVVNPPSPWRERARYSLPFFLHLESSVLLEALPSCVGPERPLRDPVVLTAGEFLQQRLIEIGLSPGTSQGVEDGDPAAER